MRKAIIRRNRSLQRRAGKVRTEGQGPSRGGGRALRRGTFGCRPGWGEAGRCVRMGGEGSRHEEEQGGGP